MNTHFRAQRIAGHNEKLQIYSMRKETPLDNNSDSISKISKNEYSGWRRETPIEFEETLEMKAGNEETQTISETIC